MHALFLKHELNFHKLNYSWSMCVCKWKIVAIKNDPFLIPHAVPNGDCKQLSSPSYDFNDHQSPCRYSIPSMDWDLKEQNH